MLEAKKRTNRDIEFSYLGDNEISNLYYGKKYFLKTYGCQMNMHDSEEIRYLVENLGFKATDIMTDADLIILNTCAIRENAQDKVFGFLGRCKHLKMEKPETIICVCGCMAQERSVCDTIMSRHSYIDIIIGTHNKHELRDMLINLNPKQVINVESNSAVIIENIKNIPDSKVTAWVNIMYGCDKFCTYCIVPYTRGKQRSRKHEYIIKEIYDLIKNGYKEVTLLGQNVNAYGKDREGEISFGELLQLVSDTKIDRIRFVTSHPWDFTDEMIAVMKNNDNIMNSVHLPVQSGSNRILKLMGRRYTKEQYMRLFHQLKEAIPNISITTDIIVGFPGETESDFLETIDLVNECQFDGAYTFVYSPRENTPAAKMEDVISLTEKSERLARLNEIVNSYSLKNNQKYLNQVVEVLILDYSEKDKSKFMGYTDTNKVVNVSGANIDKGEIIKVLIEDTKSFSMDGKTI